jgi:subtilisin family serine protease
MRPAWSDSFRPGALRDVSAHALRAPITREWALGGADGTGVSVAVVDSGIEAGHSLVGDVATSVAVLQDTAAPGALRIADCSATDLGGHGTACAGVIRSVAPGVELHSIRVLGGNLRTRSALFVKGLEHAIERRFDVVNMSLSTGKRDHFARFHELADRAYFQGTMLVCAASNVAGPTYPSEFAGVFSVAAGNGGGALGLQYNPVPPVEFGAPGIDVELAWTEGAVIRGTGNSFAAPHVAGLIALILSKHRGLTPFQVKTILHAIADNAA